MRIIRSLPREASQVVILVLLVAFFGILSPRFFTLDSLVVMLRSIAAPGFVALGIALCAISGMIDISIGAIAALASVTFATLIVKLGVPWWVALPITLVMGALAGMLNITAILKSKIPPILVSIGAMFVYRGFAQAISNGTSVFPLPEWMKEVANARVGGVSWAFWLFLGGYAGLASSPSAMPKKRRVRCRSRSLTRGLSPWAPGRLHTRSSAGTSTGWATHPARCRP